MHVSRVSPRLTCCRLPGATRGAHLALLLAGGTAFTGCQSMVKSAAVAAAEQPAQEAMQSGNLRPSDYQRERDAIRQVANERP